MRDQGGAQITPTPDEAGSHPGRAGVPVEVHLQRVRRWVAEEPISRAVVEALWHAEHGTYYAPTVQTYRAVARLVVRHLWDEGEVPRPAWATEVDPGDVTPVGERLIDALMFHLGHLSADGEVLWGVLGDPEALDYGRPFPWPHPHTMVGSMPQLFASLLSGRTGLSALDALLPSTRSALGPGAGPPLGDEEFSPEQALRARRPRWGGLFGGGVAAWDIDVPEPLVEVPEIRVHRREPTVEG